MPTNDPFRNSFLARAQLGRGRVAEAIRFAADGRTSPNPLIRGFAGYIYARAGRPEEAEKSVASVKNPNEQALIFAGLGDKDGNSKLLIAWRPWALNVSACFSIIQNCPCSGVTRGLWLCARRSACRNSAVNELESREGKRSKRAASPPVDMESPTADLE